MRLYFPTYTLLLLCCLTACMTASKATTTIAPEINQQTTSDTPEPTTQLIATFTHTPIPPSSTPSPTAIAQATATRQQETLTPSPETLTEISTINFISWDEATEHVGEEVTLCGPVMDSHYAEASNGQPTFLNLGEKYPNPDRFTIVIWGHDRDKFLTDPTQSYQDQEICVTGTIEEYNGALEIIVSEPAQIIIP